MRTAISSQCVEPVQPPSSPKRVLVVKIGTDAAGIETTYRPDRGPINWVQRKEARMLLSLSDCDQSDPGDLCILLNPGKDDFHVLRVLHGLRGSVTLRDGTRIDLDDHQPRQDPVILGSIHIASISLCDAVSASLRFRGEQMELSFRELTQTEQGTTMSPVQRIREQLQRKDDPGQLRLFAYLFDESQSRLIATRHLQLGERLLVGNQAPEFWIPSIAGPFLLTDADEEGNTRLHLHPSWKQGTIQMCTGVPDYDMEKTAKLFGQEGPDRVRTLRFTPGATASIKADHNLRLDLCWKGWELKVVS